MDYSVDCLEEFCNDTPAVIYSCTCFENLCTRRPVPCLKTLLTRQDAEVSIIYAHIGAISGRDRDLTFYATERSSLWYLNQVHYHSCNIMPLPRKKMYNQLLTFSQNFLDLSKWFYIIPYIWKLKSIKIYIKYELQKSQHIYLFSSFLFPCSNKEWQSSHVNSNSSCHSCQYQRYKQVAKTLLRWGMY